MKNNTKDNNLYSTLPKSIFMDLRLGANDYRVYGLLSGLQGIKKYAFPSINFISTELSISKTSVYNSIKKLKELNWLGINKRLGHSNYYVCRNLSVTSAFGKNKRNNDMSKARNRKKELKESTNDKDSNVVFFPEQKKAKL